MLKTLKQFAEPVNATIQLIQQLNVKVCKSTINETLLNHPDYPGILSIADSLKQWHIDNVVLKTTEEKLLELPLPFIAHTDNKGFITIIAIKNNYITFKDNNGGGKIIKLPIGDFITNWSGVVLLAEINDHSGEERYKENRRKELIQLLKIPALLLLAALAITLNSLLLYKIGILNSNLIYYTSIAVLKLIGIVITSLLLWYEVDKANPLLKQICTGGATTNCNAILSGKQSKLFGLISWSEIGFFYFSGSFLYVLAIQSGSLEIISFLNVISLPYTFFSVYYQWRIAKQWCVLCLGVQALLVSEFLVSASTGQLSYISRLSFTNLIPNSQFLTSFLLPVVLWYILKPNLLKAEENKRNKRALMRLKYDTRIFNALLPKQKQIEYSTDGIGITIGNVNAQNTIIKVCNPYCGPCATAHPEIEAILEANPNVKAQIIFTATNKEDDFKAPPVKHLLAIAAQNNEIQTKQALDDWYLAKEKNYEQFALKYPLNGEVDKQAIAVEKMNDWCTKTAITFTPTIFINGYQMPDVYSVKDLKYLLS
jgi:hypothetical protein